MADDEVARAIGLLKLKLYIAEKAVGDEHLQEVVHFLREIQGIGVAAAGAKELLLH